MSKTVSCRHCGVAINHFDGRLWHDSSPIFPQYCRTTPSFSPGHATDGGGWLHEPPLAFPQPEITYFALHRLILSLLSNINGVWGEEGPPGELLAEWKAWVNFGRSRFPDQQSPCMIDGESEVCRARLPFDHGDRWEHVDGRWSVVKPDGRRVFTSNLPVEGDEEPPFDTDERPSIDQRNGL